MSLVRWQGFHQGYERGHAIQAGEPKSAVVLQGRALVARLLGYSDWRNQRATAVTLLHTWRQRFRSRRELRQLSEAELRDMRISRCDAAAEASKPFWRA